MSELTERLNAFEGRLRSLETELYELRRVARAPEREPEPPFWIALEQAREPAARKPEPKPEPSPPRYAPPPASPPKPLDLSFLFSARALAWTGGAVTLLGIVFFFVLAVERGWIGPGIRVTLGALASALAFGAGIWLRRRFGDTYASVSAVGAGVAGFYATLLAAAALYDLLPSAAALGVAAAIAVAGSAVALRWNSQTIAGLGLVGAMLVPVPVAFQGGLTAVGTAFVAVVLAATLFVAIERDWHSLLLAAVLASAPQIGGLVLDRHAYAIPLATAFWLIYAAAGVWNALRRELSALPASLLVGSAAFAGYAANVLFDGRSEGLALLVVVLAYGAASAALFVRDRDTSSVLWALALALGAIAAADLVSGATLTITWSVETALLAWLARRIDEPRFQLSALGWFVLALGHALLVDAPFTRLFVDNAHPLDAAPSAAALAIAAALLGLATHEWSPRREGTLLRRALDDLRGSQPRIRLVTLAAAGVLAVYAASLAVVGLPSKWDWGHVAVAGVWCAAAVAALAAGLMRGSRALQNAGVVWTAASIALVLGYDLPLLDPTQRSWAFAIVALASLVVAVAYQLYGPSEELNVVAIGGIVASAGLASACVFQLLDGHAQGAALLVLAAGYGAVGVATLRRQRDLATTLGLAGLVLAVPASTELLSGTWLVLAWSAAAAVFAIAARAERRLELASLAYLALALGHALVFEAEPADAFIAHRHPGAGAPAIVLVILSVLVVARTRRRWRVPALWVCGALALYAATLGILEGFETIGGGLDIAFQRGHTAVSALWGVVGLALLYGGLTRRVRALQLGGFALFGISLAKVFLYDLAFLSSVARAFSFLAVGAVLLVGGFFYQRLTIDSHA